MPRLRDAPHALGQPLTVVERRGFDHALMCMRIWGRQLAQPRPGKSLTPAEQRLAAGAAIAVTLAAALQRGAPPPRR